MTKAVMKLRSRRGETLVELLVSIILLGLSITILAVMLTTAYNMNVQARHADDDYYAELSAAENQSGAGSNGTLIISSNGKEARIDIKIYGEAGDEALISYGKP